MAAVWFRIHETFFFLHSFIYYYNCLFVYWHLTIRTFWARALFQFPHMFLYLLEDELYKCYIINNAIVNVIWSVLGCNDTEKVWILRCISEVILLYKSPSIIIYFLARWNFVYQGRGWAEFFSDPEKGCWICCHVSLANLFNKCYKKAAFMKSNWIWVYIKYELTGGRLNFFLTCSRKGLEFFICAKGGWNFFFQVAN